MNDTTAESDSWRSYADQAHSIVRDSQMHIPAFEVAAMDSKIALLRRGLDAARDRLRRFETAATTVLKRGYCCDRNRDRPGLHRDCPLMDALGTQAE